MGASGILGGLVDRSDRSAARLYFLAGMIGTPLMLSLFLSPGPQTNLTSNLTVVIGAGLLVGIETRFANGCTSGHGVCGISRFSVRGIVATILYIAAGAVTLALFRHVWGLI